MLVEFWAWGLFFLVWAFWQPWVILISLFWTTVTYLLALQSARAYADLLESAFDTLPLEPVRVRALGAAGRLRRGRTRAGRPPDRIPLAGNFEDAGAIQEIECATHLEGA